MSLTKILIKSSKKLESFLNTIPIPIHAWQIRRNNMFLIDYNSAAYEETEGEIKNYLGSIAAEFYKKNIDLLDVLKECVDKCKSISKEIKYFSCISNELKELLIKTDFIPPDLVLVQKISKASQNLLEHKVKESKEKYFLITENAHDLIGVINRQFKFEYLNEHSLSNILGYTTKDIIGKNVLKFIHPEVVNLAIQKYSDGFKFGESIGEMRARHKQGHYVWLELKGKSYTDHNGEEKGVIISRDITQRKLLEQRLMESEEKYRNLFEKSPYMIILINANGDIIDFNQNTLKYLRGINKSDLIGRNFLDLNFIPLKHVSKLKELYKDLLGKGFSNPLEFQMDSSDKIITGTDLNWIEVQSSIVKIGDDNLIQVIIQDISERKKAEEKIRENEEMFRKFFEESQDGIILTDENGIVIRCNKRQERISGIKKSNIIGYPVWDAFYMTIPEEKKTEERYNFLRSIIEDFFKKGKAPWLNKLQEIDIQNTDGFYKCCQELTFSIRTNKGLMIGSIIRDITESKNIKQKLIESETKYRIAYDQADFYKNLCAHDFSNILLVISGSSQLCSLLLKDPEKVEEVKANLDRIREQVIRANLLIKNVQKLSELDSNRPLLKPIDICTSLTESIKYINESYKEKHLEINVNSDNDQLFVSANDLILDLFENILINAIKYNDKPIMKISIKISKIEKNNNNYVKLEFSDNGIGIQDSRKEFIFQEGHKREKYTKGMGFGLTLVKKIVDSYNGQIWVEDRVPNDYTQGCNFVITIPTR